MGDFAQWTQADATHMLRHLLAAEVGREALKVLLTEDGVEAAWFVLHEALPDGISFGLTGKALAAAVDALDSPEGDT